MRTSLVSLILAVVPALAAPNGIARGADPGPEYIEGKYIIQLKPGTSPENVTTHHNRVRSLLRRRDGAAGSFGKTFQIGDNFNAYSGSFDDATLGAIRGLDEVLTVERDRVIRLDLPEEGTSSTLQDFFWVKHGRQITQYARESGFWSLGDLSHRKAGVKEYVYDETAGEGMTAYVLDTGIRLSHNEFEGRASFGYNAFNGSTTPVADENGHGTHIAGIIAGKFYGVAKKAKVVDVRVFRGALSTTEIILAGITWAVKDIKSKGTQKKSVLNMSFAGTAIPAEERAVKAAYDEGILSVVAAGNDDGPANNNSPAREPVALTVGMTERNRSRVVIHENIKGSSYGPELDVFAPGRDIISAGYRNDTAFDTKTGTSMSTALVSGLVCYLRGLEGGFGTPDGVTDRILELATPDVVANPKGSPNLLVNNGSGQ